MPLTSISPGSGGQNTANIPGSGQASEFALSGESKKPYAVQFLSDAILLADSKNYFMGYFDSRINSKPNEPHLRKRWNAWHALSVATESLKMRGILASATEAYAQCWQETFLRSPTTITLARPAWVRPNFSRQPTCRQPPSECGSARITELAYPAAFKPKLFNAFTTFARLRSLQCNR